MLIKHRVEFKRCAGWNWLLCRLVFLDMFKHWRPSGSSFLGMFSEAFYSAVRGLEAQIMTCQAQAITCKHVSRFLKHKVFVAPSGFEQVCILTYHAQAIAVVVVNLKSSVVLLNVVVE